MLVILKPPSTTFPKNVLRMRTWALSRQRWPDGWSGYGAVMSAVQPESGSVASLSSSAARGIAFHGRQKSQ